MSTLSDRIRSARLSARLTQAQLADSCRVTRNAVTQWESNDPKTRTTPGYNRLRQIATTTGISISWLMNGDKDSGVAEGTAPYTSGDAVAAQAAGLIADKISHDRANANTEPGPPLPSAIPVISWIQAGTWAEMAELPSPAKPDDWILAPMKHGRDTYALRVVGDSMTAPYGRTYPAGAIIYVDPEQAGGVVNGDRVVAKLAGEDAATFKVYAEDAGRKFLKALNASYPPITDEFQILGKVIGMFVPD